jgi:hypothetical protein
VWISVKIHPGLKRENNSSSASDAKHLPPRRGWIKAQLKNPV